eukprot:g5737.t1
MSLRLATKRSLEEMGNSKTNTSPAKSAAHLTLEDQLAGRKVQKKGKSGGAKSGKKKPTAKARKSPIKAKKTSAKSKVKTSPIKKEKKTAKKAPSKAASKPKKAPSKKVVKATFSKSKKKTNAKPKKASAKAKSKLSKGKSKAKRKKKVEVSDEEESADSDSESNSDSFESSSSSIYESSGDSDSDSSEDEKRRKKKSKGKQKRSQNKAIKKKRSKNCKIGSSCLAEHGGKWYKALIVGEYREDGHVVILYKEDETTELIEAEDVANRLKDFKYSPEKVVRVKEYVRDQYIKERKKEKDGNWREGDEVIVKLRKERRKLTSRLASNWTRATILREREDDNYDVRISISKGGGNFPFCRVCNNPVISADGNEPDECIGKCGIVKKVKPKETKSWLLAKGSWMSNARSGGDESESESDSKSIKKKKKRKKKKENESEEEEGDERGEKNLELENVKKRKKEKMMKEEKTSLSPLESKLKKRKKSIDDFDELASRKKRRQNNDKATKNQHQQKQQQFASVPRASPRYKMPIVKSQQQQQQHQQQLEAHLNFKPPLPPRQQWVQPRLHPKLEEDIDIAIEALQKELDEQEAKEKRRLADAKRTMSKIDYKMFENELHETIKLRGFCHLLDVHDDSNDFWLCDKNGERVKEKFIPVLACEFPDGKGPERPLSWFGIRDHDSLDPIRDRDYIEKLERESAHNRKYPHYAPPSIPPQFASMSQSCQSPVVHVKPLSQERSQNFHRQENFQQQQQRNNTTLSNSFFNNNRAKNNLQGRSGPTQPYRTSQGVNSNLNSRDRDRRDNFGKNSNSRDRDRRDNFGGNSNSRGRDRRDKSYLEKDRNQNSLDRDSRVKYANNHSYRQQNNRREQNNRDQKRNRDHNRMKRDKEGTNLRRRDRSRSRDRWDRIRTSDDRNIGRGRDDRERHRAVSGRDNWRQNHFQRDRNRDRRSHNDKDRRYSRDARDNRGRERRRSRSRERRR